MTLVELDDMYNHDKTFREYVNKYARYHRTAPEYALKCMVVRKYAEYLKGGKK